MCRLPANSMISAARTPEAAIACAAPPGARVQIACRTSSNSSTSSITMKKTITAGPCS